MTNEGDQDGIVNRINTLGGGSRWSGHLTSPRPDQRGFVFHSSKETIMTFRENAKLLYPTTQYVTNSSKETYVAFVPGRDGMTLTIRELRFVLARAEAIHRETHEEEY